VSPRANQESLEAHAYGNKERLRRVALERIRDCGERGATADELCAALGMVHNSIAPRVSELKSKKLITELYDVQGHRVRRKTRQGCAAGVLVASEYAWSINQVGHFQSTSGSRDQGTMPLFVTETGSRWVDPEEQTVRR
jgi:hypothetical protein